MLIKKSFFQKQECFSPCMSYTYNHYSFVEQVNASELHIINNCILGFARYIITYSEFSYTLMLSDELSIFMISCWYGFGKKCCFFYTHCIGENLIYLCKRRFNTMQYHLIYRLDVKHASNLSKMLFCPICKSTE